MRNGIPDLLDLPRRNFLRALGIIVFLSEILSAGIKGIQTEMRSF